MQMPFEKIFNADLVHPLERKSLLECQKNPLYDWLANRAAEWKNRLSNRADAALSMFPVTKFTAPRLNRLYEIALERLNCREKYPLFLKFDYKINFEVSGSETDSYIIVFNDSVEELTDNEILALFGQALGKIKAGQVQNVQLLKIFESLAGAVPFFGVAVQKKMWSIFAEWLISAQFTMDRAALFACGSEKAVVSLLMKQSGAKDFDLEKILEREIIRPNNLGIYFVWQVQKLPTFGIVERIQELHGWINSATFKKDYPGLYLKSLAEIDFSNEELFAQVELHKAAASGNVNAVVALAEKYLYGEELPPSKFMAEKLFRAATFSGNARAMYIYSVILEKFSNVDVKIIQRLREISARRGFSAAIKKVGTLPPEKYNPVAEKVCSEFHSIYKNQTVCRTNFEEELQEKICASFWINPNEKILAAEIFSIKNETFGTAVTAAGIYGRLSADTLPFYFSWQDLQQSTIYQRQLKDGKNYLTVGEEPVYCVGKNLRGTMAEILIQTASNI
ncbi:MAG: hypothetical protein IJT73_01025 [Selenomonadaceae bacterium]|nr:hypothetical protein [Selenomonadaceae bacterium]